LRSLNNLILHFTTRTDDSHAVPLNNYFGIWDQTRPH